MIADLTDEQIERRLDLLDDLLAKETNAMNLACLNRTYRLLIEEQARRDLIRRAVKEEQTP